MLSEMIKQAKYVEVDLFDGDKVLKHFFVRQKKWGIPAGVIEKGESPRQAAQRELLERTGYKASLSKMIDTGKTDSKGFRKFVVHKKHTNKVAKPGELGGYSTKIKWVNR